MRKLDTSADVLDATDFNNECFGLRRRVDINNKKSCVDYAGQLK